MTLIPDTRSLIPEVRVVAAPHPFTTARVEIAMPAGLTLAEMIEAAQPDPALAAFAHVYIDDWYIPRDRWRAVRPRPGRIVTIRVVPQGGGGKKNPLRTILTIAVIAASFTLGGPLAGLLGVPEAGITVFGTLITQAQIGGAIISVVGTLLISAIAPPPRPKLRQISGAPSRDSPTLFLTGARNRANPFGVVPRPLGKHRMVPPLGALPFTEIVGDDQYLRMLFVWGYGPLDITDLRIGETPLASFSDVEIETVNGFAAADITELVSNGDFATDTVWTKGTGWSIAGGVASCDGSQTADSDLSQSIAVTPGLSYRVSFTLANVTAGKVTVDIGGAVSVAKIENGQHSVVVAAGPGGAPELAIRADAVFVGDVDDVSVKLNDALALFPDDVFEDALSITLTQATSWQVRTTQANADEISVDISFPQGLAEFDTQGAKQSRTVTVEVESSPAGQGVFTARGTIAVTARRTSAIRRGLRFTVERGQYDVRLRRITADTSSSQIFDTTVWTAVRTITNEDPIKLIALAKTAFRIKATDQLNGVIDQFNGVVQSIAPDWDSATSAWIRRATSNPASLYREVLQGAANARPLPDSRLDLTVLQDWHGKNIADGREFNMVIDFASSVHETLGDIAASGRASPAIRDGKWSVVIDEKQTVPIQHFTPRNSWGFSARKIFADLPHGFRVRFANRDRNWRQDERIVFDDGFDASNATKFEGLELVGITDPSQVWRDGRFHIAVARLRPEIFSFSVDIEHIVCTRGDLIRFTHDVPLFGLASARVKQVQDDGTDATGITLDEIVTMEVGKSYTIRFRKSGGSTLLEAVNTVPGETDTLTFTTPVPLANAPAVDDLAMFGESGSESVELVVRAIEPGPDLTARLMCLAAAPAVHDSGILGLSFAPSDVDVATDTITISGHAFFDGDVLRFTSTGVLLGGLASGTDYFTINRTANDFQVSLTSGGPAVDLTDGGTGTHTATRRIPAFQSRITTPPGIATPAITDIRSDGTVLLREPDGSFTGRILVTILRPSRLRDDVVTVEARFRVNGSAGAWTFVPLQDADAGEVSIQPVEDGETYDFELRYVTTSGLRGDFGATQTHTVVGKTAPPADVTGFSVSQNGDVVNFRWTQVPDLDLDGYEIRFGPVGGTFADATPLTEVTRGTAITNAQVPPGSWMFHIVAVDTSGNRSTVPTTSTATITETFDVILQDEQAPPWPGTLTGFVKHHTGVLVPDSQNLASDGGFDTFDKFVANPVAQAIYEAPEQDVGFDDTVRVWAQVVSSLGPGETAGVANPAYEIDYRKTAESFDGFEPWTIGNVEARFVKQRIVLTPADGVAKITGFKPTADLLERTEGAEDVTVAAGGTAITYGQTFHSTPRIIVTNAEASALIPGFTGVSTTGFTAHDFNTAGVDVGGTINWEATGV